jgi:colanic acid biosynthesis glycosyl transferase WcaI
MTRILIWSPNYAPELTGIPPLVTDAAEWLVERGHTVEVVTTMPNYPERRIHDAYRRRLFSTERRNGVVVHRSWLKVRPEERLSDKLLYELSASTLALPAALRCARRADVVLCVVPTLLAATYATTLLRRTRVVLWVQDLVLQAAASVTMPTVARRVLASAAALERRALARADRVVVCSAGFRDAFVRDGIDWEKIDVIQNWADLEWIAPAAPPNANGHVRFLYSGNLGYTQGLETLVEAAQLGRGMDVAIVGAGNARRSIVGLAGSVPNVTVRPPVAREDFPALLAAHDVHVVMQRRAAAGANLPSKIASYLASGRPVIASIDPTTPAAQLLRDSGSAILVEPESAVALAEAMEQLRSQPELRRELGRNGRAFAEATLGKEGAMAQLEGALLG